MPDFLVALIAHKVLVEIGIIELAPLCGCPCWEVYTICYITHMILLWEVTLPDVREHLLAYPTVQHRAWTDLPANGGATDGDEWVCNDFFGGDLAGITQKLDHLQKLGITAIYLNPAYSASSNHRYDARDYGSIDPFLGDFKDLEKLAGIQSKYSVQFVTWDWSFDRKGVSHGHYYTGLYSSGNYEAAKRDFATRSGLIPEQQLFREKQLIEIYRCCTDTLQGSFELSYDQEKTIQDVRKQIEECLPDIMERIQQQDTEPTQEQTM